MTAPMRWNGFETREALAAALAEAVGEVLRGSVEERGAALLAVSGGSTPKRFFGALSEAHLPWTEIAVTLCDERFVPPSSDRSNEGLVRANLLQDEAKGASFVPLFSEAGDIGQAARRADEALSGRAIDVAVLGMGEDGHTLSFFPDADELEQALDPQEARTVMAIHAQSAGEARLTLTLPPVMRAGQVFLHIEGEAKRGAFDRAMEDDAPIRRVIEKLERPIEVFWAP